jgi:uncharacterized membrane protein YdjX (TVP38/TMEM64 family)
VGHHRWHMSRRSQVVRLGCALALLCGGLLVLVATPVGAQLWQLMLDPSAERLSQLLAATTLWLPMVLVGLMVLHTLVPVPAEPLALAAGMLLGQFWGFVTIWVGAMLGAYVGFFLARTLGQPVVRRLVAPERLERLMRRVQQADIPVLLALRLLPVVSFNLLNFALGLSPIHWWRFTWTTGAGIVPVTALIVVFGAHLDDWRVLLLMLLVAVVIGLGGYRVLRSRRPSSRPPHALTRKP